MQEVCFILCHTEYGRGRKGHCVIEERRRHFMRVADGSTLGKESPRGTLPSMTILVTEITGVAGLAYS
jgi:hypothetical protein